MRTWLSMVTGKGTLLVALTVVLLVCGYLLTPRPVVFKDVAELKAFAMRNDIFWHSGNPNGIAVDCFYVADHPVTLDDFDHLQSRLNCGATPAWKGVLWVCNIEGQQARLYPDQIGGKWRVWGNVLVAGDENLMDHIEELFRNQ